MLADEQPGHEAHHSLALYPGHSSGYKAHVSCSTWFVDKDKFEFCFVLQLHLGVLCPAERSDSDDRTQRGHLWPVFQ